MKATRAEVLENLTWREILSLMVSSDEYILMESDIKKFMSYKHNVPQSVLNAVMMKAIITAKRVHGEHTTINNTYLRITFESFVLSPCKKHILIKNAHQAVAKLDKEMNDLRQKGIVTSVKQNPEYVDQYIEELKALEATHYQTSNKN